MISNIKIPRYPVLIVEDKKPNQVLLESACSKLGIASKIASNGQIAIDFAKSEKFSIYIVDIMLPVMDGKQFIEELKKIEPNPVVIIQSALDASDTIIDVMRLGVFDYIIKPIDLDIFTYTLIKALEFKHLKDMESEMIKNESNKLRGQLEWLNYKETLRLSGKDSYQKNSIYNLSTSLSQGAGMGLTISLIDVLKMELQEQPPNNYIVNKDIIDLLFENNDYSRRVIESLNSVVNLMDKNVVLEKRSAQGFVRELSKFFVEIRPFLEKKNLNLNLPVLTKENSIEIDIEKLNLVLEELLINAYKYSISNSNIDILANFTGNYFCITVKNSVDEGMFGGIPEDKEKLVLEPFYRIHPPVEDIQAFEKFSLGLGLTVVDYIVNRHNGMFFIHNAVDHTSNTNANCVLAEIFLPIIIEGEPGV